MEEISRKHAEFDTTTAEVWREKAEIYAKLKTIDERLQMLRSARSGVQLDKKAPG
jgi:hypothetical protein